MKKIVYPFSQFVGIDVSKQKLDIAVANSSTRITIDNTQEAIQSWITGLERPGSTIVVIP